MNEKITEWRKTAAICCALVMFTASAGGCVLDLSDKTDPDTVSSAANEQISVPGVESLSIETASEILAKAGLTYSVKEEKNDSAPGIVIMQYPEKGEKVNKGDQITLVVSVGNDTDQGQESTPENTQQNTAPIVQKQNNNSVLVKSFVNQSFDDAKWYYESNGLTVQYDEVYSNDHDYGVVVWQSIMPADSNTYVEKGTTISFQVSVGSAKTTQNTVSEAPKQNTALPGKNASFSNVRASSVLPSEGSYDYKPENVLNFNGKCWTENKSGVGIGEYVEFTNSSAVTVSSCGVVNGYTVDTDRFNKNGRLTKVTFEGDDVSYTYSIDPNSMQEQIFKFPEPMQTCSLKIIIADAVSGTKYSDTCISVIIPYQ